MKAILQRCRDASVSVDGKVVGKCEHGLLILLGVANGDTEAEAETLAAKASKLRIFEDDNGKMNLSVADVGGSVLLVSQFTLLANCQRATDLTISARHRPRRRTGCMNISAKSCVRQGFMWKRESSGQI